MSLYKKIVDYCPRPSLDGLCIKQVRDCRDNFIKLYLAPHEMIKALPTKKYLPSPIEISCHGVNVTFLLDGKLVILKVEGDHLPCWHVIGDSEQAEVRRFRDIPILCDLIKSFVVHFPFAPTDHHLTDLGI